MTERMESDEGLGHESEEHKLKAYWNSEAPERPPRDAKERYREIYDEVTKQLDSSPFGEYSIYLNYGYVANDSPQFAKHTVPPSTLNPNSVKLILELVGNCDLAGRRLLDVGCGRGGTISVLDQFFSPPSLTGVDLSQNAIAYCRRTQQDPRIEFHEGDAEALPFADESFDVVTNLESSHCYPTISKFYSEVMRVLVPGGHFLYTDVLPVERWKTGLQVLNDLGFTVEQDRDITANVLLSCDQVARRYLKAYARTNDQKVLEDFLSTPGSFVYEGMRTGNWVYRMVRFRKPICGQREGDSQ